MMARRINANKPHLWKTDIAASVDQFNQWFMRFAPEAFRSTRVKTTGHVKAALLATRDLRNIDTATLKDNPSALSTLRMCTAPPLAVDRLIGLADASKNLVGRMEDGKLPTKMNAVDLNAELTKLSRIISKLLDRDIFPWLDAVKDPTDHERDRASTIVADRLCSAVANPIVRNAQEQRQLKLVGDWLDARGYRKQGHPSGKPLTEMEAATYTFRMNLAVGKALKVNIPVDVVIKPKRRRKDRLPILMKPNRRVTSPTPTSSAKKKPPRSTSFKLPMAKLCRSCCFSVATLVATTWATKPPRASIGSGSIASTTL
jgi:hypothetical protein